MHTRVSELEQQLSEKIDPMQEKLLEVEKQTLWRIRDCEDLLKSRVSGSYIDDQVVKIEQRLKSEVNSFGLMYIDARFRLAERHLVALRRSRRR